MIPQPIRFFVISIFAIMCINMPSIYKKAEDLPSSRTYTLVLDAGHGGIDKGVIGIKTGVPESELNLIITRKLEKQFRDGGFRVILTRLTFDGLYGTKAPGFKKRDMNARSQIIKSNSPDIVVSIHMNYYSSAIRRGLQVFYVDSQSKALAQEIQNTANVNLNKLYAGRDLSILHGDYYILKCAPVPSVLIECGFLSNPEDEELLLSSSYQDKIIEVIYSGIVNYLSMSSH